MGETSIFLPFQDNRNQRDRIVGPSPGSLAPLREIRSNQRDFNHGWHGTH